MFSNDHPTHWTWTLHRVHSVVSPHLYLPHPALYCGGIILSNLRGNLCSKLVGTEEGSSKQKLLEIRKQKVKNV